MDSQRWHLHERACCIPIHCRKFFGCSISHNDFTSQRQVSVKPGAPKTTSISQNIDLIVALGALLTLRSDLENGAVCMASHNLEVMHWERATFVSNEKRADRAIVTRKIVSFTIFKSPRRSFLDLNESILRQKLLAVINSMEVA